MELTKLNKAIHELSVQSLERGYGLTYAIHGNSMSYFICEGDEVLVEKRRPADIRIGDIVLWKSTRSLFPLPVTHRVMWRKKKGEKIAYLTKGDFNLRPDPCWIDDDEIIGKITSIKKKGVTIGIDRGWGRMQSIAYCLLMIGITFLLEARRVITRLHTISGRDTDGALIAYSSGITADDWGENITGCDELFFQGEPGRQIRVCDIGFGGYSEEAMRLVRKGADVKLRNPFNREDISPEDTFTHLIMGRIINIVSREMRVELYARSRDFLEVGGNILISYVNPGQKGRENLWGNIVRRICGAVKGSWGAKGSPNAMGFNGQFTRCDLPMCDAIKEIAGVAGLEVTRSFQKGNSINIVVSKKAKE